MKTNFFKMPICNISSPLQSRFWSTILPPAPRFSIPFLYTRKFFLFFTTNRSWRHANVTLNTKQTNRQKLCNLHVIFYVSFPHCMRLPAMIFVIHSSFSLSLALFSASSFFFFSFPLFSLSLAFFFYFSLVYFRSSPFLILPSLFFSFFFSFVLLLFLHLLTLFLSSSVYSSHPLFLLFPSLSVFSRSTHC